MINRVGQVWATQNDCVYLIVDWCILPQVAAPGLVWIMRVLHEGSDFLPFSRIVQMHDQYLTENLTPLFSEPLNSVVSER